jgi:hypothetical protein
MPTKALAGPVARNGDADQILTAEQRIRGIEFNPPGAWEINLHPGMGLAAADQRPAAGDDLVVVEVSRDEARSEAEAACSLHHQQRVIATATAARGERAHGILRTQLFAAAVREAIVEGLHHRSEDLQTSAFGIAVDELPRPQVDLMFRVLIMTLRCAAEVGDLVGGVAERIAFRVGLDQDVLCRQRVVFGAK